MRHDKTRIAGLVKDEEKMRPAKKSLNLKGGSKAKSGILATSVALTGLMAVPRHSEATLYTLTSNNSVVNINPFADTSQVNGLYNWTVDGVPQAHEQGFWYSTGSNSAANVAALTPATVVPKIQLLDSTGKGSAPNFATVNYQGNGFTVNTRYQLTGGATGSNFSDLNETVVVTNTSTTSVVFHLDDYTDLDLGASASSDSVSITSGGVTTTQTNPADWAGIATSSSTPSAYEASVFPTLVNALNGGTIGLNDAANAGPGNVSNALEFDQTITASSSQVYTINEVITGPANQVSSGVPEPTAMGVLLCVSGLLLIRRRRDRLGSAEGLE